MCRSCVPRRSLHEAIRRHDLEALGDPLDHRVELTAVVLITPAMTKGIQPGAHADALKAYLVNRLTDALTDHVADEDLAQDYVLGDKLEEHVDWSEDAPDGARLRVRQIWSTLWRRVTS